MPSNLAPGPDASPPVIQVLEASAVDLRDWGRRHPAGARALVVGLVTLLGYTVFRAGWLGASDLVHGYLIPTRGLVFDGRPLADFPLNSFPLFFYVVMTPLAALPDAWAALAWSTVMVLMAWGAVALIRGMAARLAPEWPAVSGWVSPLLALTLLLDNLFLGQSNVFALFFLCAAAYALAAGREVESGLWLSVAVAFKLTPAAFALLYLVRGQWRALAALGLGLAMLLGLLPALAFGPEHAAGLTREWTGDVLAPFLSGEAVRTLNVDWRHTNQSLEAFLHRHLTPYGREHYHGLHAFLDPACLTEAEVHRLALALKAVVVAALAAVAWRSRSSPRHLLLAVALVPFTMLWLSPVSWYSHYVLVLVPYLVAAGAARAGGPRWLSGALALAVAATTLSLTDGLRSYSLVFLGQVALWGALLATASSGLGATAHAKGEGQPGFAPLHR